MLTEGTTFFNIQNFSDKTISIIDQIIQNNVHSEANLLETNRNHLSIAHLNRQSMSSTFDEFQVMLYQHPFDIITLSKTWLRNDKNLLQNVQIPGYSFYYKNRDERLGGGVGIYIKDAIKYKGQQDLSKLDETIEHMWIECQGKNKNKNYLVGVFYQPRPEDKEKLIWIQKLDTILSAITTTWNKTIVIAGDTNIDYNKPSTLLETYKEVLGTYNLKQHIKKPTRQGVKTIDHIVSNLETEKVLRTDVLPCPTVSHYDTSYAIIKIPTALFQTRYKYFRDLNWIFIVF